MAEDDEQDNRRSTGSRIAVIEKAVRTLDALLPVTDGLTPTEVAEVIGTNRSTAFRLLTSLEQGGLLDRDRSTGRYHLGIKLLQYGSAVRGGMPIIRVSESTLANLRDETRQSVLLAIRDGWGARCLSRLPGPEVDVVSWSTGEWLPMHLGAAPQALMSAMSDAEIDRYLEHNADWHTLQGDRTAEDIRAGIELIRQRGWSLNKEGITQGVASLGAVVYNRSGAPVCAISVAGLEHHYAEPRLEETAAAVLAAAKAIQDKLD
jgi:DNA-binding IclR family transcriptional regulator